MQTSPAGNYETLPARIRRNLGWRWRRLRKAVLRRLAFRRLCREAEPVGVSDRSAIVFAPHQDDETLGCGGVIAAKCRLGAPLTVVFLTDGGACSLDQTTPEERSEISALRRQEALRALAKLGVASADVVFLDFPDGELSGLEETERAAVSARIRGLLEQRAAREVFVPFRNDYHPDHQMTHRFVEAALTEAAGQRPELWQYFVWSLWESACLRVMTDLERSRLVRVELAPDARRLKRAALSEYGSQLKPGSIRRPILLPNGFVRFLTSPYELFLKET